MPMRVPIRVPIKLMRRPIRHIRLIKPMSEIWVPLSGKRPNSRGLCVFHAKEGHEEAKNARFGLLFPEKDRGT